MHWSEDLILLRSTIPYLQAEVSPQVRNGRGALLKKTRASVDTVGFAPEKTGVNLLE
jgi:hypothetical protein